MIGLTALTSVFPLELLLVVIASSLCDIDKRKKQARHVANMRCVAEMVGVWDL